ncbi:MAG: NfeD family protein [Thermoplasmata archaeon]|nr:NfeD family protein [Thermoplasmata archaeon]MCI4341185.1 NfeD family protein [Thermoplasmata archaeon]
MSDATFTAGLVVLIIGIAIMTFEIIHPGAFLLIPGSVLIVSGLLYMLVPDFLLATLYGPLIVAAVAVAAMLATVPMYQRMGSIHRPMTTNPQTLAGEQGLVIAPVVPDSLRGKVQVGSEIWSARSVRLIPKGTRVRVLGGQGVAVTVEPLEGEAAA